MSSFIWVFIRYFEENDEIEAEYQVWHLEELGNY